MSEWLEVSAKTTEEAITEALIKLGTTSDHVEYEVLEKESRGFFGIGSRLAKIRARIKEEVKEQDEIVSIVEHTMIPKEKAQENIIKQTIISKEKPQEKKIIAEGSKNFGSQPSRRKKEEQNYHKEDRPYRENETKHNESQGYSSSSLLKREEITKLLEGHQNPYSSNNFQKKKERDEDSFAENKEQMAAAEERETVKIENIEELKQDAEKFLKDIFKTMDMNAQIEILFNEPETTMEIDLKGQEMGILIGKRGQTLDSLQYLVSLVINRKSNSYVKVKLDTENYRERRRETLENLAKNIAFKVKRTKHSVTLEPMNPYERRIIHSALQYDKFVETHSEGEEPYRKVVVTLKRNGRDYGNRRGNGRGNYRRDYKKDYNNYRKSRQMERESQRQTLEE